LAPGVREVGLLALEEVPLPHDDLANLAQQLLDDGLGLLEEVAVTGAEGGDRLGLIAILQEDQDRAGMILRAGEGLRLGQRHEDGVLVEGGSVGAVYAADGELLLIDAAIRTIDKQVDAVEETCTGEFHDFRITY
jgi:hypothetical protein